MGVSRYRTRSRSFVPVIGNVRRDASRVSGRVAVIAFVASALWLRGARRGRSHRDHSESSGGGVEAEAPASRRAIGGTACSVRCPSRDGRSAATAGASALGRSAARSVVGSGERRARPAAVRASLAASSAAICRCLATSGSRSSSRNGTRASSLWMPNVTDSPGAPMLVNPHRGLAAPLRHAAGFPGLRTTTGAPSRPDAISRRRAFPFTGLAGRWHGGTGAVPTFTTHRSAG
jgi:hypothetical protein